MHLKMLVSSTLYEHLVTNAVTRPEGVCTCQYVRSSQPTTPAIRSPFLAHEERYKT
jgi:hypothetical protein